MRQIQDPGVFWKNTSTRQKQDIYKICFNLEEEGLANN